MAKDWQQGGFGLYVHWPYCESKCPYCDFNSHVSSFVDQKVWRDAYLKELDRVAVSTGGRVLNSIFFGGGTPSLMDPDTVAAIIAKAREIWIPANDLEVTLEANPGSVEAGRFTAYRDGGVNRVSMGVQALNDKDLKRLGRLHTVAEARAAFEIAKSSFDRVSFDLIYARQDQSLSDWRKELNEALSMSVDHLSLYQLTIEDGTAFGDRYKAGRLRGLPDEGLSADMYDLTQELCEAAGMPRYEVSNHARPEAQSRHNLIYWRYGDYVGIGPGAHGRLSLKGARFATEAIRHPIAWLGGVNKGAPELKPIELSTLEQAEEYVMMGLRISEGIDLKRFSEMSGQELNPDTIERLRDLGMIDSSESRISVSNQGVKVLNAVILELLDGRRH
ncbi:MAG: radical SAM family heme chaperone HemW [Arenibacterium sp.]